MEQGGSQKYNFRSKDGGLFDVIFSDHDLSSAKHGKDEKGAESTGKTR